jgi:prevent-host-death family protein
MRTVGLKILKNKLSEYVRLAAAGETVIITDRNRAVAEIVPMRQQEESFVERGVREGWLTPAKRPFSHCRRAGQSPDTRWSNCWPISTLIEKIAGDLHRQFGSTGRLVC